MHQVTIDDYVRIFGKDIYSGKDTSLEFSPAPTGSGIVFTSGNDVIRASFDDACKMKKCIGLRGSGNSVSNIVHVLSAAYCLGIDNLEVKVEGGTCPATDNSAADYIKVLKGHRVPQDALKSVVRYCGPDTEFHLGKGKPDTFSVMESQGLVIDWTVSYPYLGEQHYRFEFTEEGYEKELSRARESFFVDGSFLRKTFDTLLGLHGIDERNALLVSPHDGKVYKNCLQYGPRYGGMETVRHKVLDTLGLLALAGKTVVDTEFRIRSASQEFVLSSLKKLFGEGRFLEAAPVIPALGRQTYVNGNMDLL